LFLFLIEGHMTAEKRDSMFKRVNVLKVFAAAAVGEEKIEL